MDLTSSLVRLGLSKNEAAVYLALLEEGTAQAGPLVNRTKLHRMLVYTALKRLQDAGLVTVAQKKRVQFFQAVDPVRLIEQAQQIQEVAESIVPVLQKMQSRKEEAITVKTFFGKEGLITNLKETLESAARHDGREICIMGGAGGEGHNPIAYTGDWYTEYVQECQKLKIIKRLIIGDAHKTIFAEQFSPHPNNKMRVIDAGFSTPMFTRMTKDLVSIEIYQPHITVIQIRSAIVAQSYLDSFETLWKIGRDFSQKVNKKNTSIVS